MSLEGTFPQSWPDFLQLSLKLPSPPSSGGSDLTLLEAVTLEGTEGGRACLARRLWSTWLCGS